MKKIVLCILTCFLLLSGCDREVTLQENDMYQYYYEQLDESEKEIYLTMYTAIVNHKENAKLKGVDKDTLEELFVKVRNDHPELFWLDNQYSYTLNFADQVTGISFEYIMDKNEAESIQKKIDEAANACISSIDEDADDYKKLRSVYTYVIKNTEYISPSENDQNIQSVFVTKRSVCAGYARAVQYLLSKLGIDCAYMEGYGTNEYDVELRHAWNMVRLEDDWYYMDATWGDKEGEVEHACNAYFLMTSDEMLDVYKPSDTYEETKNPSYKWYESKSCYFTSWNASQMQKLWRMAKAKDVRYIEMKCSPEIYDTMVERIVQKGEMYEIMRQMGMFADFIWCTKNDELHTIEVFY